MLQVCLNGARSAQEHFDLPVRAEQLARAAADAVAAGATDIHLHPKGPDGTDDLSAPAVAATLRAVRAATPGVRVGIATGSWTMPEPRARLRTISSWTVLPDHAAVNWHDPAADDIARALLDRGIGVEAGVHSGTDGDQHFLRSPLRHHVLRVLAEITDTTARGAERTAASLLERLRPVTVPILLHGEGPGAWTVLDVAARRGLDARIGLEDTLHLPDGDVATDNAALVTAALHRWESRVG
ncbi:3-keto-5-aminohexanoate cleavage protein [Salinifilum aidingensis]